MPTVTVTGRVSDHGGNPAPDCIVAVTTLVEAHYSSFVISGKPPNMTKIETPHTYRAPGPSSPPLKTDPDGRFDTTLNLVLPADSAYEEEMRRKKAAGKINGWGLKDRFFRVAAQVGRVPGQVLDDKQLLVKPQDPRAHFGLLVPFRDEALWQWMGVPPDQIPAILQQTPSFDNRHRGYPWYYKGQIHCHSNRSDGELTPWDTIRNYADRGYDFVCLTDHDQVTEVPGAAMLHVRSGESGDGDNHHILGLAVDQRGLPDFPSGPAENIQPRIDYFTQVQKTVAVLAHPSGAKQHFELDELKDNVHYTGIEIAQHEAETTNVNWWDEVLKMGPARRCWGFAGDDYHGKDHDTSFDRGWIVVNSRLGPSRLHPIDARVADLRENMKAGNFIAVVRTSDPGTPGRKDREPRLAVAVAGPYIAAYIIGGPDVSNNITSCTIRLYGDPSPPRPSENERTPPIQEFQGYKALYVRRPEDRYVRVVADLQLGDEHYYLYSQPLYAREEEPGPSTQASIIPSILALW